MLEGSNDLWTILAAAVMVVGLVGVVVPVVPGLALIWAVALIYGFLVGFGTTGVAVMVVLSVILAISVIKGVVVPKRAAAASGASGLAQVGALIGGVIGFFVVPVIGLIIGALLGLLGTEFLLKRDLGEAWAATVGAAKGFGLSALIDLVLGMFMIAAWSIWAWSVLSGP